MEKKTLPLEVKIFVLAFAKNKDLLSFHMEDEDLIDACREIRWVGKGKRVPIPEDLSMLKELRKIVLAFSEIERVPCRHCCARSMWRTVRSGSGRSFQSAVKRSMPGARISRR